MLTSISFHLSAFSISSNLVVGRCTKFQPHDPLCMQSGISEYTITGYNPFWCQYCQIRVNISNITNKICIIYIIDPITISDQSMLIPVIPCILTNYIAIYSRHFFRKVNNFIHIYITVQHITYASYFTVEQHHI